MAFTRKHAFPALATIITAGLLLAALQPGGTEAQGTFTVTVTKICATGLGWDTSPVYGDFRFTMSSSEGVAETGVVSCPEGAPFVSFSEAFSDEEEWTFSEVPADGSLFVLHRVSIFCNGDTWTSDTSSVVLEGAQADTNVHCQVINGIPFGTVAVAKACEPHIDARFTFTLDNQGGGSDLTFGADCGEQAFLSTFVTAGDYQLIETGTLADVWETGDFDVSIDCGLNGSAAGTSIGFSVPVDPDPPIISPPNPPDPFFQVICVVTNTLPLDTVAVVKECDPSGLTDTFTFELALEAGGNPLVIEDVPCNDVAFFENVPSGQHTLTEILDNSELFVTVDCSDGNGLVTDNSREVTMGEDGTAVVCTVTNVDLPDGAVAIVKHCEPGDIDDQFAFELDDGTTDPEVIVDVECGDTVSFLEVAAGDYTLTELLDEQAPDADYDVLMECTGDSEPTVGSSRTLNKETGDETIVCTVTNTSTAPPTHTIRVQKQCIGDLEGPFEFELETSALQVIPLEFADCESDEQPVVGVPEGAITLTETDTGGATTVTIQCYSAERELIASVAGPSLTFELTGDTTCFVANAGADFTTVTLAKECVGDVTGPFTFRAGPEGEQDGVTLDLDCGQSFSAPEALGVVLEFEETDTAGAAFTSIDCGDGPVEATIITVEVLEPTTCTFTNADEALDLSADVGVTADCTPAEVAPDDNVTCTLVVTNHGPQTAQNVSLTTFTPANTTLVSFTGPGEPWECEAPAPGGTGAIFCDPDMAPGASASFTLVLNVDDGAPLGAQLSLNVAVDTDTEDPNPDNDTAVALVIVAADGGPAAQPTPIVITIDNDNTNVIGIDNANENANLNSNANENENENANRNQNDNANTNTQDQGNGQDQDNSNEQTNNIEASPEVNIGR